MKDDTFIIIGIFLGIIISIVTGMFFLFGEASASDSLYGVLAVFVLEALCLLAHQSINGPKI